MDEQIKSDEVSDLGRLSNSLDSLTSTLTSFGENVARTHSDVFKEQPKERPVVGKDKVPRNKIVELIDKVELCFDIQKEIMVKFEDFQKLLA